LAALLADRLSEMPGVQVFRSGTPLAGIVGFTVDGTVAESVRDYLNRQGVAVTLSTPLGSPVAMRRLGVQALVRASVHYYNTEDDIDALIRILGGMAKTP
jgi:cysteine desulfurase / selenocysteine lyase